MLARLHCKQYQGEGSPFITRAWPADDWPSVFCLYNDLMVTGPLQPTTHVYNMPHHLHTHVHPTCQPALVGTRHFRVNPRFHPTLVGSNLVLTRKLVG